MNRYIVTVNPPIFISVEADDPEQAKGIAEDHWIEQRTFEMIENAVDRTDFYIGDVDLFDSHDTTVEEVNDIGRD